ncbi:MAG: ADP-ribosylglycohydrolase family protein [Candidatus Omnitrophica bacterium]|nr:ADP-ribosylglycohydrolase family protein [Candidatus Omnitrophota bacterium]
MLGAIIGDIVGSVYEFGEAMGEDFILFPPNAFFTDDTVMTIAVAEAILTDGNYEKAMLKWGKAYPHLGYGGMFQSWLSGHRKGPYNSFGNGSAMRVSPVGFAFNSEKEVLDEAKRSAECTHNHPEGIKGAQATAFAIWLGRQGESKDVIRTEISKRFFYDLNRTFDGLRFNHSMDETCQGTVPVSMIAFFESRDFEDAIRKVVSLGGDTDTLGAITGGIAQAFYKKIPDDMVQKAMALLPTDIKSIINEFYEMFKAE